MRPLTHRASKLVCSGMFVLGVAVLLAVAVRRNGGRIVFLADDPYIHMAMARNLARHGVWGVTHEGFSSTSSAPLWTCLLAAAYLVLGVGELAPLLLNVLLGLVVVALLGQALESGGLSPPWALAVSAFGVVTAPLATIALCGMEHTLQIALALAVATSAAGTIAAESEAARRKRYRALLLLAALLVGVRYEGLFLVGVVAVQLAMKKRSGYAAGVVLAGAAPAMAYGAVSLSHGWFALPNSVLLKGHMPPAWTVHALLGFGASWIERLGRSWDLVALALAAIGILGAGIGRGTGVPQRNRALLVTFLGALVAHSLFAATNYRYEAYLVVLGIAACAVGTRALLNDRGEAGPGARRRAFRFAVAALASVLVLPLLARGVRATAITVRASQNIYQQQYQMGLFLRQFHPGGAVAVNDIGAVSYLADVRLLDLWGLASLDVARAKRGAGLSESVIDRLASREGVEVAVIYEDWYAGALPRAWVRAGSWRIRDNVVCGGDTVTFFAASAAAGGRLAEALRAFSARLPDDVIVSPEIRGRPRNPVPRP